MILDNYTVYLNKTTRMKTTNGRMQKQKQSGKKIFIMNYISTDYEYFGELTNGNDIEVPLRKHTIMHYPHLCIDLRKSTWPWCSRHSRQTITQ